VRAAVVVFPGTNCDRETFEALKASGLETDYLWHNWTSIDVYDLVVLPGGFSYGDYLRPGAIARFSPVMNSVEKYVESGRGILLGICNGFQILTEAGLLPGAFLRNECGHFICKMVDLEVKAHEVFANVKRLKLYIAHSDGNYVVDEKTVELLEDEKRILFKYAENPNGSSHSIAGVANENFCVFGMMPHPERSTMPYHESNDGLKVFSAMRRWINAHTSRKA